jgi:hypothetical protein
VELVQEQSEWAKQPITSIILVVIGMKALFKTKHYLKADRVWEEEERNKQRWENWSKL